MTGSYNFLIRFNISQNKIKNLNSWKNKKGPFRSLSDILEVEGLSIKILEKICINIIANADKSNEIQETKSITKTRKQFVTPSITNEQIEVSN